MKDCQIDLKQIKPRVKKCELKMLKVKKINILLNEDNPGDTRIIRELLNEAEDFSFNLIYSSNLQDGLRIIEENAVDVILLDLSLPDSNGHQTIVRTREKAKEIPIIILTGLKDEIFARKAVQAGAQDYFVKGQIDSNPLARSIYYAIERHRMKTKIESLVETLQKDEYRLRKIIEGNADSIIIVDKNNIVQFVNPIAEKFFEQDKQEFIGLQFGYPTTSKNEEIILIRNDGTTVIGEVNIVDIEWEGEFAKLLTVRDVSEHRMYQRRLQESEKKYRELFENSPYPILIFNKNGFIVDCNSGLEKLIGYTKEELINQKHEDVDFIRSEDSSTFKKKFEEIIEGNIPDPLEMKLLKKNHIIIWSKLNFSFINLGKEIFIYLLIQDVTKLKQSEQELRKIEQTLHEMNVLIENAPLAIFLTHKSGKILRANQEAINLFKYPEDELLNFKIFDLFNIEYSEIINKHYNKDVYNIIEPNNLEVMIKRKDGRVLDVEITSNIIEIADNIIIQSFISDITERKNFERNREKLLDQLIYSSEFKTKFLATMSHELRTPLNSILGFSQLLLMESYGNLNNTQKNFLRDITSAGEDLLSLIDSILDLSKIEAGMFQLNLEKVKLQYLIEQVKNIIRPLYVKKNLGFLVEGIKNKDMIKVDPMHFKRILYNLLSNAIKFTLKGVISMKCIERSDHWEFQIIDMGVGIAKQDFDVVFREFGRVENDTIKKVPGTGLGLALTKRLVQLHGGELWFESELGKGSTFFFTIPKLKNQN